MTLSEAFLTLGFIGALAVVWFTWLALKATSRAIGWIAAEAHHQKSIAARQAKRRPF